MRRVCQITSPSGIKGLGRMEERVVATACMMAKEVHTFHPPRRIQLQKEATAEQGVPRPRRCTTLSLSSI